MAWTCRARWPGLEFVLSLGDDVEPIFVDPLRTTGKLSVLQLEGKSNERSERHVFDGNPPSGLSGDTSRSDARLVNLHRCHLEFLFADAQGVDLCER